MIKRILPYIIVACTTFVLTGLYFRTRYITAQEKLIAQYRDLRVRHEQMVEESQKLQKEIRQNWAVVKEAVKK